MSRNLSPLLRQELANLGKDAGSRRSAIKALKSYVKDLDSKAIPHFLAEVSETKAPGSSPGECTISLYEVLARVHGRKIVPQIENIMSTIMRTLASSGGSFPLHQACSKVVPAVARYAIDPSTPGDEKTMIICSLCKPLSDALMDLHESTASGAALCLNALVEADNWRFAPDDMVNEVCLKVAGALEEKVTQTNYHMGLVMALAKHNSLISEAYARSFLWSGLQVLTAGVAESNSQKRLSAILMINSLMKYTDPRSISSELVKVADAMEKCQSDQMEFIRRAALETLQTTKVIASQKGSKQGICSSPSMESSFFRRNDKSISDVVDEEDRLNGSPDEFPSPESQTIDSFVRYDAFTDSPISIGQPSVNFEYARRSNRRLWDNDLAAVDVSLKDGLFLKACSGCDDSGLDSEQLISDELHEAQKEHSEVFAGFVKATAKSGVSRSATPSPQKSRSQLTLDDIKIYSTPRKLIRSLQDQTSANFQVPVFRNPASGEVEQPMVFLNGDNHSHSLKYKAEYKRNAENMKIRGNKKNIKDAELVIDGTESVSSTDDTNGNSTCRTLCRGGCEDKNGVLVKSLRTKYGRGAVALVFGICLVFLVILLSAMRTDNNELYFDVVPT